MLKNGEKAEFYKIPYGTEYQITEEKNSCKPSYEIDAVSTVKKADTGKAEETLSTETETIDMGESRWARASDSPSSRASGAF